jgi:hypothetical protein
MDQELIDEKKMVESFTQLMQLFVLWLSAQWQCPPMAKIF